MRTRLLTEGGTDCKSVLLIAAAVVLAARALAADPAPAADKPAELPGPFHPYNVTGDEKYRGTYHCLVSEHGLDPVVLVFVRGDEPCGEVKKLLAALDDAVATNK